MLQKKRQCEMRVDLVAVYVVCMHLYWSGWCDDAMVHHKWWIKRQIKMNRKNAKKWCVSEDAVDFWDVKFVSCNKAFSRWSIQLCFFWTNSLSFSTSISFFQVQNWFFLFDLSYQLPSVSLCVRFTTAIPLPLHLMVYSTDSLHQREKILKCAKFFYWL